MAAMNLAVPSFNITLPSNDLTAQPQPKQLARMSYSLQLAPLVDVVEDGQCWELALSNIEFYNSIAGRPVFVNCSLVGGTRIGSAVANLLYRIPGPELTSVGKVAYIPREASPLFTAAVSNLRTVRLVEVSLTDAQGNVLSDAGAGAQDDTFVTVSVRRCG